MTKLRQYVSRHIAKSMMALGLVMVPATVLASVGQVTPGPGMLGLVAAGIVGAIAVARSQR